MAMRNLWLTLGLVFAGILLFGLAGTDLLERAYKPNEEAGELPFLADNQALVTVNTIRLGSDDPIETAVAVAQTIYPATESENVPGAVVLVHRDELAEAMIAANRVQHFPINAPLLYVDDGGLPEPTRNELLRLEPEGVGMDGNVQVYLVGRAAAAEAAVQELGFKTRAFTADDPAALAELVDTWASVQHGDHRNEMIIANLDNLVPAIPGAFWNAHMGDGFAYVTDGGIPEATRRMLGRRSNGPWLYVFGDETVVPEAVVRELAQYGHVTRMTGADVAETSSFFAGFRDVGEDWGAWWWKKPRELGWGISEPGHNAIFINVNGPAGWANALPASTLSHMGKHGPALAIDAGGVPDAVASLLRIWKPYPTAPQQQLTNHGWIIGGPDTISWETQVTVDQMLDAYLPWPGE